jgi:AcrR family transcriptional regulator
MSGVSHTLRYVSSPAPATRAASADETRRRLLDAAIDRFAAGAVTSFEAVATDAGVTKGALYHHFASKNGLVEEVYKEAIRRHAKRVTEASAVGDGRTRLLALVDASARLYGSRTPFYRLLTTLHLEAGTNRRHLEDIARRVQRRQRQHMIELVRSGQKDGSIRADIDAEAVGLTVNAALEGFLVQQLEPQSAQRRWVAKFRTLLEDLL